MHKIAMLSGAISLLFSCQNPSSEKLTSEQKTEDSVAHVNHVPLAATHVYDTVSRLEHADEALADKLFGSFYEDRATYYVIPNPDRKLYGQAVDRMVLYYLDSEMLKVKYSLSEDIVHQLIRDYGKFKIKALDSLSQSLLDKGDFLVHGIQGKQFSDSMMAYRITWEVGDKQLVYEVHKSQEPPVYEFVEKSAYYDDFLLAVKMGIKL
ncbi:hypothetical protein QWY31_03040 [Cytophagales bacterium LB-30]|uniref:Lipoprotein n=1 Tax=Shiella aurantiaca TaxID=3058365 RepID=A0ABT8F1Y4_9BACT|nr:hypothetical protein [Shiella aurantiaca]MDN4164458.1 hypothetical protein [Shiella aurantiaca]